MKNLKKNLFSFLFLSILLSFTACEDDIEDVIVTTVETEDFTTTIDENVKVGDSIGKIQGSTNNGSVIFKITSETPEGAFNLDTETGVLRVLDELLFDFEENYQLKAVVNVVNGGVSAKSNITVYLNDIIEDPLVAEDFYTELEEDPENGKIIGVIDAAAGEGSLYFELISQSHDGAIAIHPISGELRVANRTLFDYEVNPTISGEVRVSNGDVSIDVSVTIDLIDTGDCAESQDDFAFFIYNLLTNQGYLEDFTMSTEVHEYTFSLNQPATVCSIGYQGFDSEPYLMQILDAEGNILFSQEMTFSFTSQENIAIDPINLGAGQSYTVRRTKEVYETTDELNGYIIFEEGMNTTFPIEYNNFTIESADFYGGDGPFPNAALPRISLGFN